MSGILNLRDVKTKCIIVFGKLCNIAKSEEMPLMAKQLGYFLFLMNRKQMVLNDTHFQYCKRSVLQIISALKHEAQNGPDFQFIENVERGTLFGHDRRQSEDFIRIWTLASTSFEEYFFDNTGRVMKAFDLQILQGGQEGRGTVPLPPLICECKTT
ncbi:hypothetical protein MAR_032155 [Mya arenaria]|uniref:Uncharacterized protein n=1 Tax=Mya arenaria TaxID=6604 RepID=A0ABY7FE73_MYAAR|nr:hypothetical protein MAR_032155 [Mya arenaria]